MPASNDFSLILHTLLNLPPETPFDFQLQETSEELILTSDSSSNQLLRLQGILNEGQALEKALPYLLTKANAEPNVTQEPEILNFITRDALSGEELFNKLFSQEVTSRVGKSWSKNSQDDGNIFRVEFAKKNVGLVVTQIKQYQMVLGSVSQHALQQTLIADHPTPLEYDFDDEEVAPLAGHLNSIVQQILFAACTEEKYEVIFNYSLLWQYLFPAHLAAPKIEQNKEQNLFTLKITKNNLLIYLSTMISSGFILATNHAGTTGVPVCFRPPVNLPSKDCYFCLLLDYSGSMQSVYESFQSQIIGFLDTIKSYNLHGKIKLVPFGNETNAAEFSLSDIDQAKTFVRALKIGNLTPLNQTMAQELKHLLEPIYSTMNRIIILFSDGVDKVEDYEKKSQEKYIKFLNSYMQKITNDTNPIRVFSLGLGDKYDKSGLEKLAQLTGGKHIPLTDIAQFELIKNEIQSMSRCYYQIRFEQEGNNHFTVSVPEQSGVATANNYLLLSQPVMVNGVCYTIKIQERSLTPTFGLSSPNANQQDTDNTTKLQNTSAIVPSYN